MRAQHESSPRRLVGVIEFHSRRRANNKLETTHAMSYSEIVHLARKISSLHLECKIYKLEESID